jgi:hypothetical protein
MKGTLRMESVRSFSVIALRSLVLLMLPAVPEVRSAAIQRLRKQKSPRFDSPKRGANLCPGKPKGRNLRQIVYRKIVRGSIFAGKGETHEQQ